MKNETVVDLIKDLTAKLSAVAEEFNGRVAHAADPAPAGDEPSETDLVEQAQAVLAERRMRRPHRGCSERRSDLAVVQQPPDRVRNGSARACSTTSQSQESHAGAGV